MEVQKLTNEFEKRRFLIVRFITSTYLVISVIGLVLNVYLLFVNTEDSTLLNRIIQLIINVGLLVFFIYLRKVAIYQNTKRSFLALSIPPMLLAGGFMLSSGNANPISYILIVTTVITSSIVLGLRSAFIYASVSGLFAIAVLMLHSANLFQYHPADTDSDFSFTVILIAFLALAIYVIKLGYEQIEHSYNQAFNYAKELEELNEELEDRVEQRTQLLKESFDRQAESVYNVAIMGRITRAMIHDFGNPLSAVRGSLSLLGQNRNPNEKKELLEITAASVEQLIRIMENAKDLMKGERVEEEFSPLEVISLALLVSRHEFQSKDIKIDLDVDSKIKMTGVVAIFERIVINLLLNAVEELNQLPPEYDKHISLVGRETKNYFVLTIKDNGRGIKPQHLESIFEPDFSLKASSNNLGFGLPFAKTSIENMFGGKIEVESKVGKWTEFTLKFKKKGSVTKKRKTKRKSKKAQKSS